MALFPIRGVRTRQPSQIVGIRPEFLAKKPIAVFLPGLSSREIVRGIEFIPNASIARGHYTDGSTLLCTTNGAGFDGLVAPENTSGSRSALAYEPSAPPLTIVTVSRANTNNGYALARGNGSGTPAFACGSWYGSNRGGYGLATLTGGTVYIEPPSALFDTLNQFVVTVFSIGPSTTRIFSGPLGQGVMHEGSTSTPSGTFVYQYGDNYRCLSVGATFAGFASMTAMGALFAMEFDRATAARLIANPWQIFEPEKRLLFNFSGSSGAYTLTAGGGTYTVQGASAGIFRSRVLSGTGGSYTLTGGQAVVSRNRKLVASGGIYNYTGQSITITHTGTSNAYTLTAQGGSYALSGGIALILKSKRITSVGGVYTLTGSDAVVLKSKYLTAASGTYSLTGGTATVLKSKMLISTGGVYSYTGSSTVIKKSKYLSALGGSYSLLGSSVVLVHGGIGGIVWPPTHLVVLGTVYGPTGSEYTGTLDVNGIKYDITTGQLVKPISDKVVMSL